MINKPKFICMRTIFCTGFSYLLLPELMKQQCASFPGREPCWEKSVDKTNCQIKSLVTLFLACPR